MFDPEGKTIAPPPHVSNGPPLRCSILSNAETRKNDLELRAESPNCVRDTCPRYQEHACKSAQVSVIKCLSDRPETNS